MRLRLDDPVRISGARIVFDTNLRRPRRMPKVEGVIAPGWKMPAMLAKSWIETRKEGRWTLAYEGKENFRRLCRVSFAPVEADALRLVVTETWGGEKAHVFGLDAF